MELIEVRRILEKCENACLDERREKLSTTHQLIDVTKRKHKLEEQLQYLKQSSNNETTKVFISDTTFQR